MLFFSAAYQRINPGISISDIQRGYPQFFCIFCWQIQLFISPACVKRLVCGDSRSGGKQFWSLRARNCDFQVFLFFIFEVHFHWLRFLRKVILRFLNIWDEIFVGGNIYLCFNSRGIDRNFSDISLFYRRRWSRYFLWFHLWHLLNHLLRRLNLCGYLYLWFGCFHINTLILDLFSLNKAGQLVGGIFKFGFLLCLSL